MLGRRLTRHTVALARHARGLSTKPGKQALPTPPSKPPPNNTWILHPAFPVDVRLLGLGLLGASFAAYQLRPAAAKTERASEVLRDAAATADDALHEKDQHTETVEDQLVEDQQPTATEAQQPAADTTHDDTDPPSTEDPKEQPVYVDGSKVVAVIEEALRPPPVASPPADHVVDVVEALEADAAQHPPAHQLDSLDDTVASTPPVPPPDEPAPAPPPPPRVTAAWLIDKSSSSGGDGDWSQFTARLKQAEADAASVQQLVNEVHAAARAEAEEAQMLAAKVLAAAQRMERAYRVELKRQAEALDMQRAAELQLQADKLAVEHQAALREAMQRHAAEVDNVREQLNTLSAAFSQRSEERRSSHSAHKLALASMALDTALEHGGAFGEALDVMRTSAGGDAVAACVLDSVAATGAAQNGVPTAVELLQQFRRARRRLGELLLVPAGALGPATFVTAKVASWLRVDSGDDALSRAEALIAAGELTEAARLLEECAAGTAAEGQLGELVKSLRVRNTVQLASTALASRARALTVSLA